MPVHSGNEAGKKRTLVQDKDFAGLKKVALD